jgi:uncharacterized protein (DUF488 family)
MAYPFFTIGHSTRTVSQFVDLLQASQIELVVDVRHIPRSRTDPQFNRETLADDLATVQIGYAHVAALGGLRNRSSRVDISPNLFWDNLSFRNYAEFHQGLTQLRDCGHDRCTAVTYAEAVLWRCHRRIIADYLICAGEDVFHILGTNHVDQARLTPGARISSQGQAAIHGIQSSLSLVAYLKLMLGSDWALLILDMIGGVALAAAVVVAWRHALLVIRHVERL